MLGDFLNMMRIDDLMLLLNIEWLEVVSLANSLDCVVASVLSLVVRMDASWIVIPNDFVDHLPSPRSAHEMLVVLNKVDRLIFSHLVECSSAC